MLLIWLVNEVYKVLNILYIIVVEDSSDENMGKNPLLCLNKRQASDSPVSSEGKHLYFKYPFVYTKYLHYKSINIIK